MKERWKNNLGLKIMAVLFAVFLWWTVVNIDDPIGTGKYKVDVVVTNPEVVTNTGKSYHIVDDTKTITVTVKARRKVLDEIKASNIVAIADLREMQGTSVPIRIKIQGFEGSYVEATANPRNIQVETEDVQKKTFSIQVVTTGSVRDGYVVGSVIASPETIDISGPKSSLGRIDRVVAKVDVSELSEDATLNAELIYYDSADNIIDKSLLSSNCDKNGVAVDVKLWKTKELEVRFDTSGIIPADGYFFDGIQAEPSKVKVAGTSELLASLQYLDIPSSVLEKTGLTENEEVLINIADYLPDGIVLADNSAGSVVVTIVLEKAGTKSLLLPVRSIKVNNLLEEFELTYGPEQEVELQFEGASEVLGSLTSEKIIATINLAEYKEEGTYDVPVQVTSQSEQCTYLGGATVQITLTKK